MPAAIASAGDEIFGRLCRALDRPDLADHPDYKGGRQRSLNRKALNAEIEAITVARDSAEWIDRFNKAGVPAGPIYAMDQVFADPQVQHLQLRRSVPHKKVGQVSLVGGGVNLSETPPEIAQLAPAGLDDEEHPPRPATFRPDGRLLDHRHRHGVVPQGRPCARERALRTAFIGLYDGHKPAKVAAAT